ncbi:MAG: hypothetical protein ACQ9MH_26645 [Nitrospinales bacterium]
MSQSENKHQYIIEVLNRVILAPPMGLYHPVIRLSFAMIHGDNSTIADALAYMAIRYFDLFHDKFEPLKETENNQISAEETWLYVSSKVDQISWSKPIFGGSLKICEQLCAEPGVR